MNLHEYQAKQLFTEYGITVPGGQPAATPDEAAAAARSLGGERWVVKAQVHAGGRGKGGGVKLCKSPDEVHAAATAMLGTRLVTHQTGPEGLPVHLVYVEEASEIARELYLGMLVDRGSEKVVVMASTEGGMDIEEVAANTPEKILSVHIDPAAGLQPYQERLLAFGLGLEKQQFGEFGALLGAFYDMFVERDCSLLEINPLIVTKNGNLMPLDGKLNLDGSALYRQGELAKLHDPTQEDAAEREAAKHDLNYVTLDGNIACMVNGAGLAMATMDIIKLHGGAPANFLDVGGGATKERVTEAFKLILANTGVKAILINIFGGIVRCDMIAEGIIAAVAGVGVKIPVVVRLEGTNVAQGRKLLADTDFDIIPADDLTDAAKKAVAAAGKA
ncbi:MAG: ADP-forming succinate--CoA ligase subunit beta [Xanthomonadaceae bacterium]|nr:ADP-forming succinate--CoA ligase subunit beta [Xanthomonadaceae bacterium]